MNADMPHIYDNFSARDDEQFVTAVFYVEQVACIIPMPNENGPNSVPIPTCPAVVAGASEMRESITTITPLSHSRTPRRKTRSSDLRADFLSDELPVVKLPGSRHVPQAPTGIVHRLTTKLTGAADRIFRRHHRLLLC
jgi:hypothetical protein